ncbi:MAG: hypothetical protein R3B60_04905 [Candidatus Paceibacterota bacterium]
MIALRNIPILDFLFKRGSRHRSLYIDKREVMEELMHRRSFILNDDKLLEIIKPTPSIEPLLKRPHLVFFRQIATPLHETLEVIKTANQLGLKLCILEFSVDKFVSANNSYKKGLSMLPIYRGIDRNGDDMYKKEMIVDINKFAGHHLSDVLTVHGENLIDFHHELFEYVIGEKITKISIDGSDWLKKFDFNPREYYKAFFSLFIKHNVLAEVFLPKEVDNEKFTKKIVWPAFNHVFNEYGFSPLIVNYQPPDEQTRVYWDCYPAQVNEFLRKKGYIE